MVNELKAKLASQKHLSQHAEDSQLAVGAANPRPGRLAALVTHNAAPANNAAAVMGSPRERNFAAAAVAREAVPTDMTATGSAAADPSPRVGKDRSRTIHATNGRIRKCVKPHAANAPATNSNRDTDTQEIAYNTRSNAAKAAAAQHAANTAQVAAAGASVAADEIAAADGAAVADFVVAAEAAHAAADGAAVSSPARSPGKLGCTCLKCLKP